MGGTAAVATILAPVAALVSEVKKPYKEAARQTRAYEARANQREAELRARQDKEESQTAALDARDQAKKRQRLLSRGGVSRRDTILTSPLGLSGDPNAANKTLLGM